MIARRLHPSEDMYQILGVNLLKYSDFLFLGLCTMQTPLMKFPFYIAMLVHLLVYIRLDSISMKLTNIFKIFSSHLIQSNYF